LTMTKMDKGSRVTWSVVAPGDETPALVTPRKVWSRLNS